MVDAISSLSDRSSIVRRHQEGRHLDEGLTGVEIGEHGHAIQIGSRDVGNSPNLTTVNTTDNQTVTYDKDEHDTAAPPHLMGLDEEWNATDYGEDEPFFIENTTTTEPPTFDELMHMAHAHKKHFEENNETDSAVCKDTFGIKTNDTREVKWNVAGVAPVTHGEGKKYKGSCVFPMGTFPDGRLEECTEAVANAPVCSNNFHLNAETYACSCVGKDLYPCATEDDNVTCLYQLNPGEFDAEFSSDEEEDDGTHFIEEWNNAEQ
jgi:hypothetical protein